MNSWTDVRTDGRETERLYRTLLKQMIQFFFFLEKNSLLNCILELNFVVHGGGWMVRCCWVNFRGVLLIWLIVEQGPTALAVGVV